MGFDAFFSAIRSIDLQKVALHWAAVRGSRTMAAWHEIRPSQISAQLPLIWVYRYDRAEDCFTGRLAGDAIESIFGKSFRGAPMRDIYPAAEFPRLFARAKRVVSEPAFYHGEGTVFRHVERYGEGERIMLPLAEDGIAGDGVLGATFYNARIGVPQALPAEVEGWFPLNG